MNKYLNGIKNADNQILKEIYQNNFSTLKRFILNNNGDEEEAKDVFQDALTSLFRRLQKEEFEIETTFGTYFFNIGKYIWYKRLKKKHPTTSIEKVQLVQENINNDLEDKRRIYEKALLKLGADCQKILKLYFDKLGFKEIAKKMNYTGEEYARRKKYLCVKSLTAIVKQDPLFKEFVNPKGL